MLHCDLSACGFVLNERLGFVIMCVTREWVVDLCRVI